MPIYIEPVMTILFEIVWLGSCSYDFYFKQFRHYPCEQIKIEVFDATTRQVHVLHIRCEFSRRIMNKDIERIQPQTSNFFR